MAIRIVRLGEPRTKGEGPRLGTVRRPPRGVKKSEYASRDYYDEWFPELAPSAKLMQWFREGQPTGDERWVRFERMYRREMDSPEHRRILKVLARLSRQADFSVGCYCERAERCHRSILKEVLAEHGATIAGS
jgi:uncharacterized protein YeaO (DUF488 family)